MRREIREKMGAVYSAFALNRSSRVDPGHGVLMAQMIVDPEAVDTIAQHVLQVADDLVSKGIEEDELRLIVGPIETSIKDMIRTNQYWLDSVLVLSNRHSEQLRWPMTLQSDFASITPEEITSLAKRYMRDAEAAQIIAVPAEKKSQKKNQ
jgi:zinc protease